MPVLPSSIMCRFSHSDALSLCPDHTTDFWDAFGIMAMLRSIACVIDVFRAITLPWMFPSEYLRQPHFRMQSLDHLS